MLKYFDMAERMPGKTGENLLSILERRLDNVVYRLGFAASRKEARQLVRHGHYTLNGKKANIPSILVKAGDVVSVAEGSVTPIRSSLLPRLTLPVLFPSGWMLTRTS